MTFDKPAEVVMEGAHVVAMAAFLSRVKVVSAYPITPSSAIAEKLSDLVDNGELDAKFIRVESEHSAMASLVGASSAGVRTFTATSSHGLAYMHEVLHWAGGSRLPIVLANANRAMGSPWNIWADQGDSLSQRDTGWIQFYCENNQDIFDTTVQAFKLAESARLPVMVNLDAFYITHTYERVTLPSQQQVDDFLPPYTPEYCLDVNDPHAFGGLPINDAYFELRYEIERGMQQALVSAEEINTEWADTFGRDWGLVEQYPADADDAEIALVTSGTITSTARIVIDELRDIGEKVKLVKMRLLRPFPREAIFKALENTKKTAVIDRNFSFGFGGIFAQEIQAAFCNRAKKPLIFNMIAGLGGRDITPEVVLSIYNDVKHMDYPAQDHYWVGLRTEETVS